MKKFLLGIVYVPIHEFPVLVTSLSTYNQQPSVVCVCWDIFSLILVKKFRFQKVGEKFPVLFFNVGLRFFMSLFSMLNFIFAS